MTITTRSTTIAALGIVAALGLGACGGDSGGEQRSAGAADPGPPAAAGPGVAADSATTALAVEAHDISLSPTALTAAPGTIDVTYTNAGVIQHTLLIDGVSGFKLDVAATGDRDTATVKLEPGTYTLYCDVPGHRAAGMQAQLTVG